MCNASSIEWVRQNLSLDEVRGKRILDVGAYDVNGSHRPTLQKLGSAEYIGVDARRGPGVDQVCFAEHLVQRFGRCSFDIVISSSTLEHVRDWRAAVSNIKQVCRPGGYILIIVPSDWPYHPHPYDYWRFSQDDLRRIFADCQIIVISEDPAPPSLVYLKVCKPEGFQECSLSDYALYAVKEKRRLISIRTIDLFSRQFMGIRFENMADLLSLTWLRLFRFCSLAFQIRIQQPLLKLMRFTFRKTRHD